MQQREIQLEEELKQFLLSNQSIIKEKRREQTESENLSRKGSVLQPIEESNLEDDGISVDNQSLSSKVQVDVSLLESPYEQQMKRMEFQRELFGHVGSIKQCVTALSEDLKAMKL